MVYIYIYIYIYIYCVCSVSIANSRIKLHTRQDVNYLEIMRRSRCRRVFCVYVHKYSAGGRVTNAVGTIFKKSFVGTRARPI